MRSRGDARRSAHLLTGALSVLTVLSVSLDAFADEPAGSGTGSVERAPSARGNDTTYGRIEGDVALGLGAGVTVAPRGPRALIDFRARYIETVGLFVTYEEGSLFGASAEPRRVFASGLELRPLFLARWLRGGEIGNARLDLLIDSIGLELGGFLGQPRGSSFGSRPGLQAGLGVELPIFAQASGPWIGLHGGLRWSDAVLAGESIGDPSDRSAFLGVSLSWHQVFGAHVVDWNDRGRP